MKESEAKILKQISNAFRREKLPPFPKDEIKNFTTTEGRTRRRRIHKDLTMNYEEGDCVSDINKALANCFATGIRLYLNKDTLDWGAKLMRTALEAKGFTPNEWLRIQNLVKKYPKEFLKASWASYEVLKGEI